MSISVVVGYASICIFYIYFAKIDMAELRWEKWAMRNVYSDIIWYTIDFIVGMGISCFLVQTAWCTLSGLELNPGRLSCMSEGARFNDPVDCTPCNSGGLIHKSPCLNIGLRVGLHVPCWLRWLLEKAAHCDLCTSTSRGWCLTVWGFGSE